MRKKKINLIFMLVTFVSFAQKTPVSNVKKDSIKTEVVEIVTSYTPKVTDAQKIKRKPLIEFSKNVDKKKLNYTFNTVPVASTFVAASQKMKVIDVTEKERLFDNYVAVGAGNGLNAYFDTYLHNNYKGKEEYGLGLKGIYVNNPVKTIDLENSYFNSDFTMFYKMGDRYFDWKIGLDASVDSYYWYGTPEDLELTSDKANNINKKQLYNSYGINAGLDFDDSYIGQANFNSSFFHDNFSSNEIYASADVLFLFPLRYRYSDLNDLKVETDFSFLSTDFGKSYLKEKPLKHKFAFASVNPYYEFSYKSFDVKVGTKLTSAFDLIKSKTNLYVYPDVYGRFKVIDNSLALYAGAKGGLQINSFKAFTDLNPYISPTINIAHTDCKYDFYSGVRGVLAKNLNFNIKASYAMYEDMSFFKINKQKVNESEEKMLLPYEYGNSFDVVYDKTNVLGVSSELEYEINDGFNVGLNVFFGDFDTKVEANAWNLPKLKAGLSVDLNRERWYASTNCFYIDSRNGVFYTTDQENVKLLESYIDLNLNGGYHLSKRITIFIKGTNLANSNYSRVNNYKVQGIQILGGLLWKFDGGLY